MHLERPMYHVSNLLESIGRIVHTYGHLKPAGETVTCQSESPKHTKYLLVTFMKILLLFVIVIAANRMPQ